MDLQKELNEWADWFIPHDSKDFRDALELNSFHQLNIEKLLALNGVSEAYVFRKKDSWKAWFYAKHQAESALLEQFEINNKLVEQIEELKAKAQAVPEWIETAIQPPEEGQKVIISGIYGVGIAEFSYLYKDEFVMYDMGASNPILSKDQVKFWMPLPDAPQEPTND